jgi:hypothetical protein
MIYVAPLFRSGLWLSPWRCPARPNGPVCFRKPGDAGKSIPIMNVHPSFGVNPPGPTTAEPFASEAVYELKIDTNGDAVADIAYRVRFSPSAGWRCEPFFLDTQGALNNLQFTGDDFFAQKDVCSIVLEVPNSALGSEKIGLSPRTLEGSDGKWVQADGGALPAQSVFLTGEEKGAYLAGEPANEARFVAVFAHSLEHAGGYTPEESTRVARTLLPDILFYDPEKLTRDNVGPHKDLLARFPYVGPPHQAPSAEVVAA